MFNAVFCLVNFIHDHAYYFIMLVFCLVNFIHDHAYYFIMSVFCLVNCHDSAVLPWLLEDIVFVFL
jgi:hypothetical protein